MLDRANRTILAVAAVMAGAGGGSCRSQTTEGGRTARSGEASEVTSARETPAPTSKLAGDEIVTAESGASFTASAGWTVATAGDHPDLARGDLTVVMVEVAAANPLGRGRPPLLTESDSGAPASTSCRSSDRYDAVCRWSGVVSGRSNEPYCARVHQAGIQVVEPT